MIDGLRTNGECPLVILPARTTVCDELDIRNIPYKITAYPAHVHPYFPNIRMWISRPRESFKAGYRYVFKLLHILKIIREVKEILLPLITEFNPDIIHTNVGPIHIGYEISRKIKIPHVWHICEYQTLDFHWNSFLSMRSFRKKLQTTDNYPIAVSKGIYRHFRMKNNAQVIYNGILGSTDKCFVAQKEPYFLYAGRLEPSKGIHILLPAFAELVKSFPEYKLYLAGDTLNADFKELLVSYTEQNRLTEHILFLGNRDDIYDLMTKATVLIVPSLYEEFGRITAEAMFNGCLVIGNCSSGTEEILKEDHLGLLYHDDTELLQLMKEVIETGIENYFPMIKKAQEKAAELYSTEQNVAAIYRLYGEVKAKYSKPITFVSDNSV